MTTYVELPQLGETVSEGTLVRWLKAVGDEVREGEPLFEVSTDKVDTEIPATASGRLAQILVEADQTVPVGSRLAVITTATSAPRHAQTPLVRRLLAEHGLDASTVQGTGPNGRITRADVAGAAGSVAVAPPPEVTRVPFTAVRRRTAEHMVASRSTAAHALMVVDVDFSGVDRVRGELRHLPFVARAVVDALARFPHLNASVGDDELLVHPAVHLGIAVDLDADGLVVPVARNAGDLRLRAIARTIAELAGRARSSALSADDLAGGTFTITNPGPFGTLLTAPIIHQPQVAILATDAVRPRPVAVQTADGTYALAVHPVGNLALSFDHRAVDGGYAARFLGAVKQAIEERDWATEL